MRSTRRTFGRCPAVPATVPVPFLDPEPSDAFTRIAGPTSAAASLSTAIDRDGPSLELAHLRQWPVVRYLDLTLPTPAENLALDEALLDEAENAARPTETLRIWEPREPMVVVGRSSQVDVEVRLNRCRKLGIPILRRTSGGAAIVTGPGCLMYAVVLSFELRPMLRAIDRAHQFVLGKIVSALEPLVPGIHRRGTSDLAIGDRKFSGNSLRVKRNHLLYHGTLLYDSPLELVAECLAMPPREPDYRQGRSHESFVANLPLPSTIIRQALVAVWKGTEAFDNWPREQTTRLVVQRYAIGEWNERR